MVKWLRKLFKNERGQALAEYQVLYPGSILMVLAMFTLIAQPVKGMYCEAVEIFSNGICADVLSGGGEIEEPTPEPTEEEEEICIPLTGAEGCSQCDQSDCLCLPGLDSGTFGGGDTADIGSLVIKAGTEYHIYTSMTTPDGCYQVTFLEPNLVTWERIGEGSHCKEISHLESWYTPVCE